MPKRFSVYWTRTAIQDLESILGFLEADSPDKADRVFDEIIESARTLAVFPLRGKIVPELREQGLLLYREVSRPPWRIFYRAEGMKVSVLAVLDARRNLTDLLLERFLH